MKIEVITSFNKSYYDLIGKECVDTWLKHWPESMTLTCYVEEFSLDPRPRIKQIDFSQLGVDYETFQQTADKQVGKFAKKAWSFIHAMQHTQADRLIWLDADVITLQDMDMELLMSLMPDNALATHLGVTYYTTKEGFPGQWFVPETGFYAVNPGHIKFPEFRDEYSRRYLERDERGLRRFYDNDVYGAAIQATDAHCVDLCRDFAKKYKTPLPHSVLGPYLHHWKAKHSKMTFAAQNHKVVDQ